jgi:transposase-like protein
MTNMISASLPDDEVLKSDALGRVKIDRSRREALLDEFEQSGASGPAFAKLIGVKYQTFASWRQKRRRLRAAQPAKATTTMQPSLPAAATALRLVEAVVESDCGQSLASGGESLCVHLPGGARVEVHDAKQAALAAELLKALVPARPC